jgi:hypothetical protein
MQYAFSTADMRMFKLTKVILGGPPEEALLSCLSDGVFNEGASAGQSWGPVDESFVRRAGADEFGMLPDILEPGRIPDEPAPIAGVLQSLRAALFSRGDPGLDLQLRAGLHRLGRAAADLDAASLRSITEGLPDTWARCLQAAWFRLSRLEECRDSAAALRGLLGNGDRK